MKYPLFVFAILIFFSSCKKEENFSERPYCLMAGTNTFHWVPAEKLWFFSAVRVYMAWEWFEAQPGKFRFAPTAKASGDYDRYLGQLDALGIVPVLCINQSPDWIRGANGDPDAAPAGGGDMSLPSSYKYAARMYYQFAARYGDVEIDKKNILVDTTERWTNEGKNTNISGLGVVDFIEIWNEPDKWWKRGTTAYFEPEQYAAMLSACYDGHEGRMGDGYGVRAADPSINVVMGGISEFDTAYVSRMALWFFIHRKDRKFAADVINYHHYCNADGGLFKGREFGISPNSDNIESTLKALKRHSYRVCRNLPVWWSEFGYDTNERAGSPQYATPDSAAAWIVASLEAAKNAKIGAAFIYNSVDEQSPENWLFQSSGLMYGQSAGNSYAPKKSYEMVKAYLVAGNRCSRVGKN